MDGVAAAAKPSPYQVFRNRAFTLLWTGQLISTTGSALTSLASSILIYRLTGSALSVGLMLIVTAVPTLVFGLIAGVIVDRYDRKKILIASDLLRAALVFLIPFLISHNIIWLYIIVLLSSSVGQFFDPAHESVIPEVASEQELSSADALLGISSFGSTAIGFAASGLIASRYPIQWAFYLDALSFVFSAACILLIKIRPLENQEESSVAAIFHNLSTGMHYLFDTPILRSLIGVRVPVLVAFGLNNVLLVPFALKALGATEFEYGIQEGMTSIGFVIGSLLLARFADDLREGQWLVISFLGMGLATVAYSFSHSIVLAIGFVTISGFLNAPGSLASRLIIQRNTAREMRGRVASANFVVRDVIYLIGMGAAGLADIFNVRVLFMALALVLIGAGILALSLPGLGQPAAEWRKALSLLRSARPAAGPLPLRPASLADFELLAGLLPAMRSFSRQQRDLLVSRSRIVRAPVGEMILRAGEAGDQAYFILEGRLVAGIAGAEGSYRTLTYLTPGDIFGEIAALTGSTRTANVVAEEPVTLMEIPAQALRALMGVKEFSSLMLSTMSERLARTSLTELPRFAGVDQEAVRELRGGEEIVQPVVAA